MNFEEVERNTTEHIIRHYSNTPLNVDYTCSWYYPPPTLNNLEDSLYISGFGLDTNIKLTHTLQGLLFHLVYLRTYIIPLNQNIVTHVYKVLL